MPTLDLDDLLPEDYTILREGKTYVLPGDLDVETAFKLIRFRNLLGEADTPDKQRKTIGEVQAFLLVLMQQRSPDLAELPFGVVGLGRVLAGYLEHVGIAMGTEEPDPTADPDEGSPTVAAPSDSSTGSQPSRKSSGGSRTRGGGSRTRT